MITIIVACDKNRLIGQNGQLPWKVPADLTFFKEVTKGCPLIMGRRTWDSLPKKPLPGRTNIVLTRHPGNMARNGYVICVELEQAIANAEASTLRPISIDDDPSEVESTTNIFIIGGASIYKEALDKDVVDRILLSKIHGEYKGDVFFPELTNKWTADMIREHADFEIWEYLRKRD